MNDEIREILRRYENPLDGPLPEQTYADVVALLRYLLEVHRELALCKAGAPTVSLEFLDRKSMH